MKKSSCTCGRIFALCSCTLIASIIDISPRNCHPIRPRVRLISSSLRYKLVRRSFPSNSSHTVDFSLFHYIVRVFPHHFPLKTCLAAVEAVVVAPAANAAAAALGKQSCLLTTLILFSLSLSIFRFRFLEKIWPHFSHLPNGGSYITSFSLLGSILSRKFV